MVQSNIIRLVVHCSATQAKSDIGVKELRAMHLKRGFRDVGYHYVIRRDGTLETGRTETTVGAHVEGYNVGSLGICMVGGLLPNGKTDFNAFTRSQYETLADLLGKLTKKYPKAKVLGHRDLSPDLNKDGKITRGEWMKDCPTFDVVPWWAAIQKITTERNKP